MKIIVKYAKNEDIYLRGCGALWNIFEDNYSTQKYGCEKGCISTLAYILKNHINDKSICETGMQVLSEVLTPNDLYYKYCTEDVLNVVKECNEKYKGSLFFSTFLLGMIRVKGTKESEIVFRKR